MASDSLPIRWVMKAQMLVFLLAVPSALAAQECRGVDPAAGYPVVAMSTAPSVTPDWLHAVARSAAYRWKVPSRRRVSYAGWERVQRRVLPPEPRWADDWRPEATHRATAHLVLRRDARAHRLEIVSGSGDRSFDQSVATIVKDPMPASLELPRLPDGEEADSIVVVLTFGHPASLENVHGVVRFASEQTRAELHRNTLRVDPPMGHSGSFPPATVKYDVTELGTVDPTSIEFVRSPGRSFENVIRDGLLRARFTAPTSNCRPIGQTVVQTFGN